MKRVALVTGGARGIGFGIAKQLARDGFDLALSGRSDASKVAKAVETLEGLGAHVLYCAGDVAAAEDRARLLAAVRVRFGRLDALVNNAGVGAKVRGDLLDVTQENFEWILRINLLGPFALSQEAARWMI
jgi:3-oxoacyl-[acyl-carrier protein] reductase